MIVELPRVLGRRPWPVWISFATPCTGMFLPVYLDGILPPALASAGESEAESGVDSMWCLMRAVQENAADDFVRGLPSVQAHWRELAQEIESERHRIESGAAELFQAGEHAAGADELTAFMAWAVACTMDSGRALLASF